MSAIALVGPLVVLAPLFLLGPSVAWLFARRGRLKSGAVANAVPPLGAVLYWSRYVAEPEAYDFPTAVVIIQILYWLCAAVAFSCVLFVGNFLRRREVFWVGWGFNLFVLAFVLAFSLFWLQA